MRTDVPLVNAYATGNACILNEQRHAGKMIDTPRTGTESVVARGPVN